MGDLTTESPNIKLSATFTEQIATVSEHQQAADALTVQILKRAEAGGLAISQEVRGAAMALMRRLEKLNLPPAQVLGEFLTSFRAILRQYEPVLATLTSDATLAGFLQGGHSVIKSLPELAADAWAEHVFPIKPAPPIVRFDIIDEAAKSMTAHSILPPSLIGTMRRQAQMEGSLAAREGALDALEKVRDALTEAVVDGDSFETFQEKAGAALDRSGLSPSRQEMLFRSTVLPAYSRGQKAVVENVAVRSIAVFAWRCEIPDSRLTALCYALSHSGLMGRDGKRTSVFFVGDPVFRLVAPQSHIGCRCGLIFLTIKRAAEKGIKIAQQWLETGMRPSDADLFVPVPDLSGLPESERLAFASWVSPWNR